MKKKCNRVKKLVNPSFVLKVKVKTDSPVKPLNGSLPRSNNSHMLRLYPYTYKYKNGKVSKEKTVNTYFIKGIRGALRHSVMKICHDRDIDVCHTTNKKEDKAGNSFLPKGFHLLGACLGNGDECVVHSIFGSMGNESKISVFAYPIAVIEHKSSETNGDIQKVHLSTENRICKTFDGKIVQDFGERYFSGEFEFEVDVTKTSLVERGLLIKAILNLRKLGRGYNAGYGHLKVISFQFLRREVKNTVEWRDNHFDVNQEIKERSLQSEVTEAMQEWERIISLEERNEE
ncbi:MAG: RAMP superfamily CRISPR-associated protein [Candidatus Hodarchaeales archaeon]